MSTNFVYLANAGGGLHTYSVDGSGNLTHIDFDTQGDTAYGVWGDGNFIYLGNDVGGLLSYSVDGSGHLTHIDSDNQGGHAWQVWGDGNFIYLANHDGGLLSYSVDGSGNLTYIDSHTTGGANAALDVWGDGNFIYVATSGASYTGALLSYSVDSSGNLTLIDSIATPGQGWGVWGDGNFIYLANGNGGLRTYSVDGSGNLTYIDSDWQPAGGQGSAMKVWGDGNFIYVANLNNGLLSYSVDSSGYLTLIDQDDQGGSAYGVWGDGSFIYLANHNSGLHTYSVDGSGNLTHIDVDDQGNLALGVWAGSVNPVNKVVPCETFESSCAANPNYAWIVDFDPNIQDPRTLFGRAQFNFGHVTNLIASSSSSWSGADCTKCSLLSSSSTSQSPSSSLSESSSSSLPSPQTPSDSVSSSSSSLSQSASPSSPSASSSSPSASPSSPSTSPSASSASSQFFSPPTDPYNYYTQYVCGDYSALNCSQIFNLSGGQQVKVLKTRDLGQNATCVLPPPTPFVVGSSLDYKITKVKNSGTFTTMAVAPHNTGQEVERDIETGITQGKITFSYITGTTPDSFHIYYEGTKIWSSYSNPPATFMGHTYTAEFVDGAGTAQVDFGPTGNGVIKVVVNKGNNPHSPTGTGWSYTLNAFGADKGICALLVKQPSALANAIEIYATESNYSNCNTCSPSATPSSSSSQSSQQQQASSLVKKCFRAKLGHQALSANEPFVGTNWQNYWEECLCCPSTTPTTPPPSSSSSSSVSFSSKAFVPQDSLCPLFHVDGEEVVGPWLNREPNYNRNLTITQGDTVCYQIAYLNNGVAEDITKYDISASIKLNFSDENAVEKFSAKLVPGTINVVELSLTAEQTTCLPVTELVYSCEIVDNTNTLTRNNDIQKVTQGYLRVEPEVTRDESHCSVFGFGPTPSEIAQAQAQASQTAASSSLCCGEYYLSRVLIGNDYRFRVEVPTEEVVNKDISYWEVDLRVHKGVNDSITELELIQNQMDPLLVSSGYDMAYPMGGGRYRFIGRNDLLYRGNIKSAFSFGVSVFKYDSAYIKARYKTNKGCVTHWCGASMTSQNEIKFDCCPSTTP